MLKLQQQRNGYVSQISSTIAKLNRQLDSDTEFDTEYSDILLARLESYLQSIESITRDLCDLATDQDVYNRHCE